ncbi:MAG: DMT family transporter [Mastigocoleus sp.]
MQGEIAALIAACLWAIASVFYGRLGTYIPPLQLNLIKGVVAIALFLVTILLTGELYPNIPTLPLWLILMSGIAGIGLGDTIFFKSINILGARRALLMQTLTPAMVATLSLIFLREDLSIFAWCGILLTILGVAWVVTERTPDDVNSQKINLKSGVGFGLLSAFASSVGAVLSRGALIDTTDINVSPLWAALIRLSAGTIILIPLLKFQSQVQTKVKQKVQKIEFYSLAKSPKFIVTVVFASFCGTYLGIWLQQAAIKFTAAGIASTLMQTSPIFVIPITRMMGEKISFRAILGVAIALSGIAVLFYRG